MSTGAQADTLHVEDFTEDGYRAVLRAARERYSFESYGTHCEEPHTILRHDVDASPQRAARIATIEQDEGVRSVYCFHLHNWFYNLLEPQAAARVREVLARGHGLGLHFETGFYGADVDRDRLAELIRFETDVLERVFEHPVEVFSFHNPTVGGDLRHDDDEVAGLINAYGRALRERYAYVSDANGYWRFRRLIDVVEANEEERLHVLTHPEWWTPEALPPRERLVRCAEGRAAASLAAYDAALAAAGRRNVG